MYSRGHARESPAVGATQCPSEELVASYVTGALHPAERAHIEQHLDACSDCREDIAGLLEYAPVLKTERTGKQVQITREVAPGASIGRYVVLHLAGTGAMGEVYAAYDPELDRKIALKLLRTGAPGDGDRRPRLVREAWLMAKLSHPNVVTVHEIGTADGVGYLAMEYVEGETLRAWVQRAQPSLRDKLTALVDAGTVGSPGTELEFAL